jgi:hypothetical protein
VAEKVSFPYSQFVILLSLSLFSRATVRASTLDGVTAPHSISEAADPKSLDDLSEESERWILTSALK